MAGTDGEARSRIKIWLMGGLHVYERLGRRIIEVEAASLPVSQILEGAGFDTRRASVVSAGDRSVGLGYIPSAGEDVFVYPMYDGG